MADDQAATEQFILDSVAAVLAATPRLSAAPERLPRRTEPLDIAIPVFNNATLLRKCLDSLLPTLSGGDEVWLFDDASTEAEVSELLAEFSSRWRSTHVVKNRRNLGFVGTANRAVGMTRRDLVLLNSDTQVTAGWLELLQETLQRNPGSGIVCPLSDNATILSALRPAPEADSALAAAAVKTSTGDIALPTAVGFCMLIRRRLLDQIGDFSQAFAPGYGEECDLSMRALRAGWDILAADRSCVYHHSGGSFDRRESTRLQVRHQARLDRLWPEYGPLVQSWWRENPLRSRTEQLFWHGDERASVVHILHREYKVGGAERITRDLVRELGGTYRQTLLYPGLTRSRWCDLEPRGGDRCRELMLNKRWIRPKTWITGNGDDLACQHSERALARVLQGSGARIVHFHHMLHWDSLLLPSVARSLGCRTVVSVHDFWFNCPMYNQLEHTTGEPCGRSRARADERCIRCLNGHATALGNSHMAPGRLAAYIRRRHALLQHVLRQTDAILVPSRFISDRLLEGYAGVDPRRVRVVEQGVTVPDRLTEPAPGPVRVVAYFGGDQPMKGARLVLSMAQSLPASSVRFIVYGRTRGFDPTMVPANVELRGFYQPDELTGVMEGVDLAVLPSYFEESFSMVLSECWAHGIPVLASARGALAERVRPGVNGWLVPDMAPASWVQALHQLLQGDVLDRCRRKLPRDKVVTIEQHAAEVDGVYRELLALPPREPMQVDRVENLTRFRKKLQEFRSSGGMRPRTGKRRCLGVLRDHWGTANYRVRIPLEELMRSGVCEDSQFHVVRGSGFDLKHVLESSGARQVAVQPFLSDEGLAMMESLHRTVGLKITLVIDDLWTDLPADNPVRAMLPDDVADRLRQAAGLSRSVVLTTDPLKRRLGLDHHNIHVINNALPGWIWDRLPARSSARRRRLRIGWSGAPQHAGDLAFLEPVMRGTRDIADWVFLGMCPDSLRPLAAEVHSMVPFEDYPATLAALKLDVGIAPLTDNPFNRCKSHLKVLEYGILGIPVIAADLEPYRGCPVSLADVDDPDDWTARLRKLVTDRDARITMGASLRQWVLDNHMIQHRSSDWMSALGMETDD